MRVRLIKSATVVIEHQGKKVLCDPWLTEGIYYGSWYSFPPCEFTAKDFENVDYLYISHVHPDHCDVETLKDFRKDIPILILDFAEKFLLRTLQKYGFTNIIEVPHHGEYQLGPDFKVELFAGDDNDLKRFAYVYGTSEPPGNKTRQIDSLAVFSGGGRTVVNSNDVPFNLISGAFDYIKSKYKSVDLLLVSYAGAGPYPQAYTLDHEEMLKSAIGAAYSFLGATFQYILGLSPRFFIPYAGEYVLGAKMWWMNKFKGTTELDELVEDLLPLLKNNGVQSEMVLLNRGEWFDVDNGQASKPFTGTDFMARERYIKRVLSNKKLVYEDIQSERKDILEDLLPAREAMWKKQREYLYFKDISLFLDIGLPYVYEIDFSKREIAKASRIPPGKAYIHAQLDHRLMNMILNREANWNNAEVGSHIVMSEFYGEYKPGMRSYEPMPHFLMPYFQNPVKVKQEVPA